MSDVCLVVIQNHRFDVNISRLNDLYCSRFSSIAHLVPFFDGHDPTVIPVYENSFYFQGYIAQAHADLLRRFPKVSHFLFIADDLILNPQVTEESFREILGLSDPDHSFIPELLWLNEVGTYWQRVNEALAWSPRQSGLEVHSVLPPPQTAKEVLTKYGYTSDTVQANALNPPLSLNRALPQGLWRRIRAQGRSRSLPYPLVGGYSDILVVTRKTLPRFAQLCGVFSAAQLHVELAIPTALALSSTDLVTERHSKLRGRALWTASDLELLEPFNRSLSNLLENFPEQHLYLHPVKLSQWSD